MCGSMTIPLNVPFMNESMIRWTSNLIKVSVFFFYHKETTTQKHL